MGKREPFGEVAVRLGFAEKEDVARALEKQKEIDRLGQKHKLLGIVMLEMGLLSTTQLIDVLRYMEEGVSPQHGEEAEEGIRID